MESDSVVMNILFILISIIAATIFAILSLHFDDTETPKEQLVQNKRDIKRLVAQQKT